MAKVVDLVHGFGEKGETFEFHVVAEITREYERFESLAKTGVTRSELAMRNGELVVTVRAFPPEPPVSETLPAPEPPPQPVEELAVGAPV